MNAPSEYRWLSREGVKPSFSILTRGGTSGRMTLMPRQLRAEYPGAIQQLMSRGDRKKATHLDDGERGQTVTFHFPGPFGPVLLRRYGLRFKLFQLPMCNRWAI